MQRLALMIAVMMLGMPSVSGCNISVGQRGQGTGNQAEMMYSPSAWFGNSGETLTTEKGISSATLGRSSPVEPGGFLVEWIRQRVRQGMEDLAMEQVESRGDAKREAAKGSPEDREYNPGLGESGQDSRPKREAAQKAMDALKKGADATRGRGQRRGRVYQRAGGRN